MHGTQGRCQLRWLLLPRAHAERDGGATGHPLPWGHQWLRQTPGLGIQCPARDTARVFPAQLFAQSIPREERAWRLPRSSGPRGPAVPALPALHPSGAMATGRAISSIRAFAKSSLMRQTEPGSGPLPTTRLPSWGAKSTQGWDLLFCYHRCHHHRHLLPSSGPSPSLCASAGVSVRRGTAFKGQNCNQHRHL